MVTSERIIRKRRGSARCRASRRLPVGELRRPTGRVSATSPPMAMPIARPAAETSPVDAQFSATKHAWRTCKPQHHQQLRPALRSVRQVVVLQCGPADDGTATSL